MGIIITIFKSAAEFKKKEDNINEANKIKEPNDKNKDKWFQKVGSGKCILTPENKTIFELHQILYRLDSLPKKPHWNYVLQLHQDR